MGADVRPGEPEHPGLSRQNVRGHWQRLDWSEASAAILSPMEQRYSMRPPWWIQLSDALVVGASVLALLVLAGWGFKARVYGFHLSVTSAWRPAAFAAAIFVLRHLVAPSPHLPSRLARAVRRLVAGVYLAVGRARRSLRIRRSGARVLIVGALLGPGVYYAATALTWDREGRARVTGDEPHYLIVSDAIVRDHSLDVRPAYERDHTSHRIFGPNDWQNHVRFTPRGVFSVHPLGISLLLAPAFGQFGLVGARLTMCLLAGLIPFVLYGIARNFAVPRTASAFLACGISLSFPFLGAAGQVYPDLTAGLAYLAVFYWASGPGRLASSWYRVIATTLVLGALPWLHIKNAAAAVVLAAMSAAIIWKDRSGVRTTEKCALLLAGTVCSIALLGLVNRVMFGSVLAAYAATSAAGASPAQAWMIFLGLHFDQAQGMFVQQPVLLIALLGIAPLAVRNPVLAAGAALSYLAILLPNAFHDCWYGCYSFGGRFMWSVIAFWFLPFAALYASLGPAGRLLVASVASPVVLLQLRVSAWWVERGPHYLYTWMSDDLDRRNSLFPVEWRSVLPSFYDFERYYYHVPNAVAVGSAALLVLAGLWLHRHRGPAPETGGAPTRAAS